MNKVRQVHGIKTKSNDEYCQTKAIVPQCTRSIILEHMELINQYNYWGCWPKCCEAMIVQSPRNLQWLDGWSLKSEWSLLYVSLYTTILVNGC